MVNTNFGQFCLRRYQIQGNVHIFEEFISSHHLNTLFIYLLILQPGERKRTYNFNLHPYVQGGSNMTGTDLYVNKPHCAAAVRP